MPSPAAAAASDEAGRADAELAAAAAPGATQRREGIPGRLRTVRIEWDSKMQLISRLESEHAASAASAQRAHAQMAAAQEEAALLRGERSRIGASTDQELRQAKERLERLERHSEEQDVAAREL